MLKLFLFIVLTLVSILFYLSLDYRHNRELVLSNSYNANNKHIKAAIEKYRIISNASFENLINTSQVLTLLEKANNDTPDVQQNTRAELYDHLKQTYENLKSIADVRQFHFHLPDGTTLLRMHRPNKFGDPLFDIRYSVKIANTQKIVIQGFEEGRTFNGYRFVYPILHKDKHLGSVEISISMRALINSIKHDYNQSYCFMLNSQIIDQKLFANEKSNYYPSPFGKAFAVDKEVDSINCSLKNPLILQLSNNSSILEKLNNNQSISEVIKTEQGLYTIHMIPVNNVEGNSVAYLYSIFQDLKIAKLHSDFIHHLALSFISMLFIAYILFNIKNQKQKLEQEIQNQTESINLSHKKEHCIRKLLETISEAHEFISVADEIDILLMSCCSRIKHHDDFELAHVKLLHGQYNIPLNISHQHHIKLEQLNQFYQLIDNDMNLRTSLFNGDITVLKELNKLPYVKPINNYLAYEKIQSILLIPIIIDDIYIGYMSVFSTTYHDYKEERIIFKDLGKIISKSILTLENKHAKLKMEREKLDNYKEIIYALVDLTEKRDTYTAGHTKRVASYCARIGKEVDLTEEELDILNEAAMLHDIGKIVTPDSILLKPGKLTNTEYRIIQEHVTSGSDILNGIKSYQKLYDIIKYHHERCDGKGYPYGIKEDEIPLLSQILIVADAFDAMTTNRVYKGRKTVNEAIQELNLLSGSQFHPPIVTAATPALKDVTISESISQAPKTDIEKERFAYYYRDRVTDAYNATYLDYILIQNFINHKFQCIHILSVEQLDQYNKNFGWDEGDKLLKRVVENLRNIYSQTLLFRVHGNNFFIVSEQHLSFEDNQLEKLHQNFSEYHLGFNHQHIDMQSNEYCSLMDIKAILNQKNV